VRTLVKRSFRQDMLLYFRVEEWVNINFEKWKDVLAGRLRTACRELCSGVT
jgi:hypothetical protein